MSFTRLNKHLLPCLIPLLLAFATIVFVWRKAGDGYGSSTAAVPAQSSETPGQTRMESTQGLGPADARLTAAELPRPIPSDSRVTSIIQAYESGEKKVSHALINGVLGKTKGQEVALDFGGFQLVGQVTAYDSTEGITQIAVDLDDDLGRFQLTHRMDSNVLAALFFTNEETAFHLRGKPVDGKWPLELSTVGEIICSKPGTTYPFSTQLSAMPLSGKKAPAATDGDSSGKVKTVTALSSDPESTYVLYMDFNGETMTHPWWTGDVIIDCEPHDRAYDADFVTRVWQRVSEDFAGFDLNVTTDRRVYDMAAIERRVLVIVTPTNLVAPGAGGVAYLNTFGMNVPCWAFNEDEASCAETVSHEVGHTLGLDHDGLINAYEYYGGHGTGKTSWAPIMGAYFADPDVLVEEEVTQWSRGQYPDATNQEDDLEIITTLNGFSYRQDDHGDSSVTASDLYTQSGLASDSGIISTNTDSDWFQFSTSGGNVSFRANVLDVRSPDNHQGGANLAADLAIVDKGGNVLATNKDGEILTAEVGARLRSGIYYLRVKGAGRGDLATGFSKYASMGSYTLAGSVPQSGVVRVDPIESDFTYSAQSSSFTVTESGSWRWSKDADWITIKSPKSQSGTQKVSFSVARNSSKIDRKGVITISSGDHEARLHITQAGYKGYDDHADDFPEATLIAQDSETVGVFEALGDLDTFRIELEDSGYLNVRTKGDIDTFGSIYDAAGTRLASNDNQYAPNFGLRPILASGTYYITVSQARSRDLGPYTLETSLEKASVFSVDDTETTAGPSGGFYSFDVFADGGWSWRTDADWITSTLPPTQNQGNTFGFAVAANTTSSVREGKITLFNENMRITHVVIQNSAQSDDHSDDIEQATALRLGRNISGVINYEADVDMFTFTTRKSGLLTVTGYLGAQIKGRLLDSQGKLLANNDDLNANGGLRHNVNAGEYFIEIRHADPTSFGTYQFGANLEPSTLVDILYRAGKGGLVQGPKQQTIPFAGDARSVTAVAERGFRFVKWSDGVSTERRNDRRLLSHMTIDALFEPYVQITANGLEHREGSALYKIDFGTLKSGESVSRNITIRNTGSSVLQDFKVLPSSGSFQDWQIKGLDRLMLRPDESGRVRITCNPISIGRLDASFRISAKGLSSALTFVLQAETPQPPAKSAKSALVSPAAAESSPPEPWLGLGPWLDVSPDGYFRYRFSRNVDDDSEPTFEISSNGKDWEEALVLDVWKVESTRTQNLFEAILAPPGIPSPRILVNESKP